MKKADAEKAIRSAVTKWARKAGVKVGQPEMPIFEEFVQWMHIEGYGHYFEFRSVMGPMADAEQWFDEELKQTWRN